MAPTGPPRRTTASLPGGWAYATCRTKSCRPRALYGQYANDDPVLTDPDTVNAKGWQVTKQVYLDGQKVRLDMARFRRRLREAYGHWAQQRQRHRAGLVVEHRILYH